MKITMEQIIALERPKFEAEILPKLVDAARHRYPRQTETMDDDGLRQRLRKTWFVGRRLGLQSKADLQKFTMLDLVAPRFFEDPKVQAILTSDDAPEDQRITYLMLHLPLETWATFGRS